MKIYKIAKKIYLIGAFATYRIIKNKLNKKIFAYHWKKKVILKKANHNWAEISKKCAKTNCFKYFFDNLKQSKTIFSQEKFFATNKNSQEIIAQADQFVQNIFDLLGSGNVTFTNKDWHSDFKLKKQDPLAKNNFDKHSFYQDIKITSGKTENEEKDIKVPWELSRFQHIPILGKAYTITNNQKDYALCFSQNISNWLENNPFLQGIHWLCPMEVAIRSINLIHAFYFFCDSDDIDNTFWETYICSLYDHFIYLENNWELSDSRTSNHYLSDLIGYFYISIFFKELKNTESKIKWCYNEIIKECNKQIFDEGTSYEGSSAYHKFVAEIFSHFYILSENLNISMPENVIIKFNKMIEFTNWCTPENSTLILIGDNDSGHILHPLFYNNIKQDLQEKKYTKNYKNFGLSLIKTKRYHITLRHHAYNKKQPTGHFHNDFTSITLHIDGLPIITDSGSYAYTSSCKLRNDFRSCKAHSGFFIDTEPIKLNENLFELNIPENIPKFKNINYIDQNIFILNTEHYLYKHLGLKAKRTIILDELNNTMTIKDQWEKLKRNKVYNNNNNSNLQQTSYWNFILNSDIIPIKKINHIELLTKDKKIIVTSNILNFEIHETWISSHYGKKIKTKKLVAKSNISTNKIFTHFTIQSR